MMEYNFFTTHKYRRAFLIGGYRYLTIIYRKGKDDKEFGDVLIDCPHV